MHIPEALRVCFVSGVIIFLEIQFSAGLTNSVEAKDTKREEKVSRLKNSEQISQK